MKKIGFILIMIALVGFYFTPTWADEVSDQSAGLQNQILWVTPQEFQRVEERSNDSDWNYESDLELYDDGNDSDARWRAAVHLPDGARVVAARWYVYDNCGDDPDEDSIDAELLRVRPYCHSEAAKDQMCYVESATDSGYTCLICDWNVPGFRTIDNNTYYYLAAIEFDTDRCSDRDHRFIGLKITYRLQMADPPDTPTFSDVDAGDWFFQGVELLSASGITQGCNPPVNDMYCPELPVTRGAMAVFLARALGLYWAP